MTVDTPEQDEYNYSDDYWRCGRNDGCGLKAGWGTDHVGVGACRLHGGASLTGKDNPNYRHGAYSKHLQSDLTDEEREAFEDLVGALEDPDQALSTIRELAAEALLKYKRSGDSRFLREYRQLADTFNLAPNADEIEVSGDGIVIHTQADDGQ